MIQQCTTVETGTRVSDYYGKVTQLTEEQAKNCELFFVVRRMGQNTDQCGRLTGCEESWNRGNWKCFVWLFAILFVSVSLSCVHCIRRHGSDRQAGRAGSMVLHHPVLLSPAPGSIVREDERRSWTWTTTTVISTSATGTLPRSSRLSAATLPRRG